MVEATFPEWKLHFQWSCSVAIFLIASTPCLIYGSNGRVLHYFWKNLPSKISALLRSKQVIFYQTGFGAGELTEGRKNTDTIFDTIP